MNRQPKRAQRASTEFQVRDVLALSLAVIAVSSLVGALVFGGGRSTIARFLSYEGGMTETAPSTGTYDGNWPQEGGQYHYEEGVETYDRTWQEDPYRYDENVDTGGGTSWEPPHEGEEGQHEAPPRDSACPPEMEGKSFPADNCGNTCTCLNGAPLCSMMPCFADDGGEGGRAGGGGDIGADGGDEEWEGDEWEDEEHEDWDDDWEGGHEDDEHMTENCELLEQDAEHADNAEVAAELRELVEKCRGMITSDDENAEETLWYQYDRVMGEQWGEQTCSDARRGVADAKYGLDGDLPEMIAKIKKENTEIANALQTLGTEVRARVSQADEALARDDCQGAMAILHDAEVEYTPRFEALLREAGMGLGDFEMTEHEDDYREIYEHASVEGDVAYEEFTKKFEEKDLSSLALSTMKQISPSVMEKYLTYAIHEEGPDVIQSVTDLGVGTVDVQRIVDAKARLLEHIEQAEESAPTVKHREILEKVGGITCGPETVRSVQKFIDGLDDLSPARAEAKIAVLERAAQRELYEMGVTPFVDTPVGEWYTAKALEAKELGFVKGTGESGEKAFDPGRETNIAEAVVLIARILPDDGVHEAVPLSEIGKELPEWAQAAAAELEAHGIDLDEILGMDRDAADGIHREEIARLILEAFDLPEGDIKDTAEFRDIQHASREERHAIAALKEAGIMKGYDYTHEFGVGEELNRAELVKILVELHDEVGM